LASVAILANGQLYFDDYSNKFDDVLNTRNQFGDEGILDPLQLDNNYPDQFSQWGENKQYGSMDTRSVFDMLRKVGVVESRVPYDLHSGLLNPIEIFKQQQSFGRYGTPYADIQSQYGFGRNDQIKIKMLERSKILNKLIDSQNSKNVVVAAVMKKSMEDAYKVYKSCEKRYDVSPVDFLIKKSIQDINSPYKEIVSRADVTTVDRLVKKSLELTCDPHYTLQHTLKPARIVKQTIKDVVDFCRTVDPANPAVKILENNYWILKKVVQDRVVRKIAECDYQCPALGDKLRFVVALKQKQAQMEEFGNEYQVDDTLQSILSNNQMQYNDFGCNTMNRFDNRRWPQL